jgi:hypothetical protein
MAIAFNFCESSPVILPPRRQGMIVSTAHISSIDKATIRYTLQFAVKI